jgi:hypothetical protein
MRLDDEIRRFVAKVLGSTENTWDNVFKRAGDDSPAAKLVPFRGDATTACVTEQSAMAPFVCPGDQKVSIDLAFYDEMKNCFKALGDFAQAYVIAHEVSRHDQCLKIGYVNHYSV